MTVRILQLLPELLDVNGDGQNALVLAQRLRWAGHEAEVVSEATGSPDIVVVGSGVDPEFGRAGELLQALSERLHEWLGAGAAVFAVGTGFELLSTRAVVGGVTYDGVAVFDGVAEPLAERAVTDLVVDSALGQLVGFENHARGWIAGPTSEPLGAVVAGHGNDGMTEGARVGSAWGTHLHGPVLAKNPMLADAILGSVVSGYSADSDRARSVDAHAEAARRLTLSRMK